MAESSAAVCAAGDAFVSFASGAAYLPGILCLQRALAQAHAPRVPCPLVIVLDDRPAHALDHASLGRLESSLTPPNRIVNLTSLFARLNGTRRALYALKSGAIPAGSHRAMCGNESRARGAPMSIESCPSWSLARALAHDRALISSSTNSSSTAAKRAPAKVLDVKRPDGQEYLRSWLKVWLWALPDIKRAVYLDGDMLIQRPLDALFDRHTIRLRRANAPGGTMAAVRASCPGQLSFNSGLFVFEPSLTRMCTRGLKPSTAPPPPLILLCSPASVWTDAVGLTRGAHDTFLKMKTSRYRPFKACELSVGDQSVLNQYFAPRYTCSKPRARAQTDPRPAYSACFFMQPLSRAPCFWILPASR